MVNKISQSKLSFAVIIVACSLFFTGCGGLFYFPDKKIYVDVNKLDTKPEQIELETTNHKKFYGWYFRASKAPRAKILFFHGNAQNRSAHFFALYWMLRENYDFFIFDYPGYADSEGAPNRLSTTDSGMKALEWLDSQNPKVPLIVFGQSLGGNIAMYTAIQNKLKIPVCLVTVDSTFKSYRKIAQRIMSNAWVLWPFQGLSYVFIGESYSADGHISEISPTPLLVFHGEDDPVVAYQNGIDVFESASEPKKFFKVPGHGHTMAFNGPHQEEFRKVFLEEIERNCPAPKLSN